MLNKIAIVFITTLLVLYANAQKTPVQCFFKEADERGYDGNYNAYTVQLFADSTFVIRVYTMFGIQFDPALYRTTYSGKYSQIKDSCEIKYRSSYSESRAGYSRAMYKQKGNKNKYVIPPASLYPKHQIIIRDGIIAFTGWFLPDIPASTSMMIDAMESKFQNRGIPFRQKIIY
jgi:hypothetical protein